MSKYTGTFDFYDYLYTTYSSKKTSFLEGKTTLYCGNSIVKVLHENDLFPYYTNYVLSASDRQVVISEQSIIDFKEQESLLVLVYHILHEYKKSKRNKVNFCYNKIYNIFNENEKILVEPILKIIKSNSCILRQFELKHYLNSSINKALLKKYFNSLHIKHFNTRRLIFLREAEEHGFLPSIDGFKGIYHPLLINMSNCLF